MHRRTKAWRRAAAMLCAASMPIAACGGDDAADGTSPATQAETTVTGSGASSPTTAAGSPTTAGGSSTTAGEAPDLDLEPAGGDVRGFDGTTIRLASLGIKTQLPGVETGVRARIKRFNDTNEVEGVKLEFVEYVDDKLDPATALSESRRLVTSENVFALVGDTSPVNPGDYFEQQKVPFFGSGYDFTFCTEEPSTNIWGFGYAGCVVPQRPTVMPDSGRQIFEYVSEKTGKEHPTLALFSNDTESGKNAAHFQAAAYGGAGFDVVYKEGSVPPPPVSDYTPYVQELLTAANGSQPDVIICLLGTDCIGMYTGLQAAGFTGTYHHTLYSDLLVQPMQGSTVTTLWAVPSNAEAVPALEQITSDIAAIDATATLETGSAAGYFSTDMFIQALTTVAAEGTEYISPENVQKAAANQTWQIDGVVGPIRYPESTVLSTPQCSALLMSDGTQWVPIAEYDCSDKQFPVEN